MEQQPRYCNCSETILMKNGKPLHQQSINRKDCRHDCEYVKSSNALIPAAKEIVELKLLDAKKTLTKEAYKNEWTRQFAMAMDVLKESKGLIKKREIK